MKRNTRAMSMQTVPHMFKAPASLALAPLLPLLCLSVSRVSPKLVLRKAAPLFCPEIPTRLRPSGADEGNARCPYYSGSGRRREERQRRWRWGRGSAADCRA
jgi:hypothetical protein